MFRLALALGCTVEELGERMSSSEFTEWAVFYAHDPWGEQRADWRTARLCELFYNAHRGRDAPALHVKDFMPPPPFEQPADQAEADEEAGVRLYQQLKVIAAQQSARGVSRWRYQQPRR